VGDRVSTMGDVDCTEMSDIQVLYSILHRKH
jgi:hypothetical protein